MSALKNLLQEFLHLKMKVAFGFEFEFYLVDISNKPLKRTEHFIEEIKNFFMSNNFFAYIDKEKEIGQLEICSIATFEIIEIIEKWTIMLEQSKFHLEEQNVFINHQAKPFLDKAGNGLHINISLHDPDNLNNLFAANDDYRIDVKNELIA